MRHFAYLSKQNKQNCINSKIRHTYKKLPTEFVLPSTIRSDFTQTLSRSQINIGSMLVKMLGCWWWPRSQFQSESQSQLQKPSSPLASLPNCNLVTLKDKTEQKSLGKEWCIRFDGFYWWLKNYRMQSFSWERCLQVQYSNYVCLSIQHPNILYLHLD